MNYIYECEHCDHMFEKTLPYSDNKKPLSEPCPKCNKIGGVFRNFSGISFGGQPDTQKAAGSGFNDILKDIHKQSGRTSTMGKWVG